MLSKVYFFFISFIKKSSKSKLESYPFSKPVAKAVADSVSSSDAECKVEEAALKAMITQIGDTSDESNLYKADEIITLHGMKEVETLLLETSSHFGSTDKSKSCFDHHKGLFGALSMLKVIADENYLASKLRLLYNDQF